MSLIWIIIIVALALGVVASNILLLKSNKKFIKPPDFKPRQYDDDEDDWAVAATVNATTANGNSFYRSCALTIRYWQRCVPRYH